MLGRVLQTKPGAALVSRLLLLAAAALFIAVLFGRTLAPRRRTRAGGGGETRATSTLVGPRAIGGSGRRRRLAATWAMAEHASTGIQPGMAMPVDVVHLLAVAVWLGGLSALLVALFWAPATARRTAAVRRFSRVAFGSVARRWSRPASTSRGGSSAPGRRSPTPRTGSCC